MKEEAHIEGLASLLVLVVLREFKEDPDRFYSAHDDDGGIANDLVSSQADHDRELPNAEFL